MSEQELNDLEQMLKDLLLNDNIKRKAAEGKLVSCLSSVQNKAKLVLYCSQLLLKETDLGVQMYCAIIIRKVFLPNEKANPDGVFKEIPSQDKEILKNNLMTALNNITNKQVRKQIADAASTFFSALVENEDKWDDLLQYSMNLLSSEINEQNITNIEFGLHLITNLYSVASDDLEKNMKIFLSIFPIYFKSNSLSLKAKTVQCLTEVLCGTISKKEAKQFKDLIFNVLETTLNCLNANDTENLKVCLDSIKDLSNCEPKILRKYFQDIFILMGKISENVDLEDNLREMCFEIIVTLIEAMPKLITDSKDGNEKLENFVTRLFKYAMELDQNIDEDWLNPSKISYISDEFIPEKKLDLSTSLLTRLFEVVDEDKLLKLTSDNVVQLINHSNDKDWKYKYIAYITVAEIAANIQKLSSIEKLISMIITDLFSPNIKVQYSCLYCIAELSDAHNPDFQNQYHKEIVPKVIQLLNDSKSLRIQLEVCDALEMFVEHMTDNDASIYLQSSLDALFNVFLKSETECPPSLKQGIIGVVQEFIHASEDEFIKYSEKCLQILLEYLSKILTNNINGNLVGPLMEVISEIGPLCPDLFKKYLITIVNTLIQINQKMPDFKGNIANYLLSTWEKLIPSLKESNKEKIPEIVNSLIQLLEKPPEMSISSNPEVKIDVNEFFADKKEEKEEEKKVELKTSETEEFTTFIETLNSFLSNCPELYSLDIIQNLYNITKKLIKYPNNDIKSEIAKVYPNCIDILLKINPQKDVIKNTANTYIADILSQLSQESDYSVIISFLDSIRDIIKSAKEFLTTKEINELSKEIFTLFKRIEKGRKSLLKEKEEAEKEYEEEKKTGDNKINSDDEDDDLSQEELVEDIEDKIDETENVMKSISDFFGALFETHGHLTLELVDEIIKNYIPNYLLDTSSNFEKLLALLLLGDMAEFLKQDLLSKIWSDICTILIKYSPHSNYEVRNAACYGLGVFAQSTTKNFSEYGQNIITAVINVINLPIDKKLKKTEKENLKFARDNAISALGKIIKYHGQEFPNELNSLIDLWLNSQPIKQDKEEAKINIKFLLDILMKEPNKCLGDNNKNLGKVIVILTEGYQTGATDEEMDKNIEQFTTGIKSNEEYNNILLETVKKQKEKMQNKMKSLFKIE
jgi:hypothetical protein